MYGDWPLIDLPVADEGEVVLSRFTRQTGRSVASAVVTELALAVNADTSSHLTSLVTENDVKWVMQIIGYALRLSFSTDAETINSAVKLYSSWLTCLRDTAHPTVPPPILRQPIRYAPMIIHQLQMLFVPRPAADPSAITRQAKEAHFFLRCMQSLVMQARLDLKDEIWPDVLAFAIAISDQLLATTFEPDDLSCQLAPKVVSVLLELWLHACASGHFPNPSYWHTLQQAVRNWRHHISVIDHWARFSLTLTAMLIENLYGTKLIQRSAGSENSGGNERAVLLVSTDMPVETVRQAWFRVLHLIGDPATLLTLDSPPPRAPSSAADSQDRLSLSGSLSSSANSTSYCFYRAANCVRKLLGLFVATDSAGRSASPSVSLAADIKFAGPEEFVKDWSEYLPSKRWASSPDSDTSPSSLGGGGTSSTVATGSLSSAGSTATPLSGQPTSASSLLKTALGIPQQHRGSAAHHQQAGANSTGAQSQSSMKEAVVRSGYSEVVELSRLCPSLLVYSCLKHDGLASTTCDAVNGIASAQLTNSKTVDGPKVNDLFNLFGQWLFSIASVSIQTGHQEDSISQRSLDVGGSAAGDLATSTEQQTTAVGRRLSNLSADQLRDAPWTPVGGGVAAGKAEALVAMLRCVAAKKSHEEIDQMYLNKFYSCIAAALKEKDRLVVSSVIVNSEELFRNGLTGVELLIPLYLDAIEFLFADSTTTVGFHPCVSEGRMRKACVGILASLVSLPTHYRNSHLADVTRPSAIHSFSEMRQRIFQLLVQCLLNETDVANIQVVLGLVCVFCAENSRRNGSQPKDTALTDFSHHVLQTSITTICQSLLKRWSHEYSVCVAALESLSFLAPFSDGNNLEGAEVVVASLCRFIEIQLSRPPPSHSRDLHSTIVTAYVCLRKYVNEVPVLLDREQQCLKRLAETVELGVSGTKNQSDTTIKKPASQRVAEAAEQLLFAIFSTSSKVGEIEDERFVLEHYCATSKRTADAFTYYVVDGCAIVALLELTADPTSNGYPSVAMVVRSPYSGVKSYRFRLTPYADEQKRPPDWIERPKGVETLNGLPSNNNDVYYFPPELERMPKCQADLTVPELSMSEDADKLLPELNRILDGTSGSRIRRDSTSAETVLLKDVKPPPPSSDCNAGRILLQDLGLLEQKKIGVDTIRLNSQNNDFLQVLHETVDKCPPRTLLTAHAFYVKQGQRNAGDILENATNVSRTSADFCRLLSRLGDGIDVEPHRHWTGYWATAFDEIRTERRPSYIGAAKTGPFILDGLTNCLYWSDESTECAILVPTNRSHRLASKPSSSQVSVPQPPIVLESPMLPTNQPVEDASDTDDDNTEQRRRIKFSFDSKLERTQSQPKARAAAKPSRKISAPSMSGVTIRSLLFGKHDRPSPVVESPTTSPDEDRERTAADAADYFGRSMTDSAAGALNEAPIRPPRSKSINTEDKPTASEVNKGGRKSSCAQDYRIFVAWLERYEDRQTFPFGDFIGCTDPGLEARPKGETACFVIYVHPLTHGLYRVNVSTNGIRLGGTATPLVDGCVVSEASLAYLVRSTILNIARRRALDQEGYVPPHVRRRQRIQEFSGRFAQKLTKTDFFTALLLNDRPVVVNSGD